MIESLWQLKLVLQRKLFKFLPSKRSNTWKRTLKVKAASNQREAAARKHLGALALRHELTNPYEINSKHTCKIIMTKYSLFFLKCQYLIKKMLKFALIRVFFFFKYKKTDSHHR